MLWISLVIILVILALVLRAYSVFVWQVPRYKVYWEQQKAARVPPEAVRYYALGDSAAQGIGASKPEKGYVGLIAEHLRKQNSKPVHVINLSVSGAKARDVLERQVPELLKYDISEADVVTLAVGGNDMRSFNAQDFEKVFAELVERLPRQTVVADVPYFGGGRENKHQRQALESSEIIAKQVTEKGLRLAKLQESTRTHNSWRNYAADFFHPSDYGYQWWAEPFWAVLQQDIK